MIGIGKLNYPLIGLRVALGVLSILTAGGPFLLLLLPPELWPEYASEVMSRKSPWYDSQTFTIVYAITWFTICSLSASLFALSLLVKRVSRGALRLALPWTGAMFLTGFAGLGIFLLFDLLVFEGLLRGFVLWKTLLVISVFVLATVVSWWFLLRGRRFKQATNDVDPLWSLHAIFLCGGYVGTLAGFASMMIVLSDK